MSLVHKIPPLVSALAFGYGVGMAAPESTITGAKAAVVAYQDAGARPARPRPQALPPLSPARIAATGIGGDESRELTKLRDAARDGQRAASCDIDRPSYSKAPRYESRVDRDFDDSDDLDTAGTEALSRLQLPDLKIAVTRRTLKYVRFFTRSDRGRGMFETWLKRSGRYQELIEGELRERRLPEDLIWVAMIESGFDPRAKSPAGAVGLWQFMPATGGVYGLVQNRYIDQRKNPRLATKAAAHHLRDLYLRFGSWDLALASYNMGYEQLLDAIDKYGTADFNELARQQAIPSETAAYVPKIAAAAIVANNLEHFGFDKVEVQRPVDASELMVPAGTPLKTIAKASGVAASTIRTLNPDILGDRVPPGRSDYVVMIPPDTVSRARAALPVMLETEPLVSNDEAALEPIDLLNGKDLLRQRARSADESLLSLLPHPKRRGTLRDPMMDDRDEPAVADGDDDDDRGGRRRPFGRDDDLPRRILGHKVRHNRETVMYRVGPGDTLSSIAKQFAIDADDVQRANKIDDGETLKVGALLKLRVRRDQLDGVSLGGDKEAREKSAPREKESAPLLKKKHRSEQKSDADALRPHRSGDKHKRASRNAG